MSVFPAPSSDHDLVIMDVDHAPASSPQTDLLRLIFLSEESKITDSQTSNDQGHGLRGVPPYGANYLCHWKGILTQNLPISNRSGPYSHQNLWDAEKSRFDDFIAETESHPRSSRKVIHLFRSKKNTQENEKFLPIHFRSNVLWTPLLQISTLNTVEFLPRSLLSSLKISLTTLDEVSSVIS